MHQGTARFCLTGICLLAGWNIQGRTWAESPKSLDGLKAVPFQDVHISDHFWSRRIEVNRKFTIAANLHQCEITGRIRNFAVTGKLQPGKHEGLLFNDSDLYKALEGVAYALSSQRDPELEKRADAIIDQIAAAQQPDGYLNTYYTLVKPQERWKNFGGGHEMYCGGHLIEAAVAYFHSTGKRKLLDVACKFADHLHATFGPDKRHEICGHEEIELALVKLHRTTKEKKYLDLAKFFVDLRGRADGRRLFGEYCQDHKPVREQREVVGHAVRAMYLYCAMADLANLTGDKKLWQALESIWHDVVDRKMYLTGGIGPSAHNEGFTVPYDLPNDSAYAETCAAIGMALWNHRLFLMSGDGKYADVLEREVFNGLLSGVSLTGDRFFYVNPLGSVGRHHRVDWFGCACCPPNICRFIPGMGERVYAVRDNTLWTVLYMGSQAAVDLKGGKVQLTQETRYPWEEEIKITVAPAAEFAFDLRLRIPGWCRSGATVSVNDQPVLAAPEKGYVRLDRTWKKGDVVRLRLPLPVERVYAHPQVKANVGRVALQRGPVVYCLEGVDNGGQVRNLVLPREAQLTASFEKNLLGGVAVVRGEGLSVSLNENFQRVTQPVKFQAVPYFAWDNRAPGQMVVWLPESPELAELRTGQGVESKGVLIRASHANPPDALSALNDGMLARSSRDHRIPRMTWWDHRGGTEWVSYRFPRERTLSRAAVYWFDDTGSGQCRVPASWRLLWLDGKEWKPVQLVGSSRYGTKTDVLNEVAFEPVATREIRLEVKLQEGFSGGILEWQAIGPP